MLWMFSGLLLAARSQKPEVDNTLIIPDVQVDIASAEDVNTLLAGKGKLLFEEHSIVCLAMDSKAIVSPLGDIVSRRSGAWLTNMIADPDAMLEDDPIAAQLLKDYSGVRMTQTVKSRDEALAIVEFLKEYYQSSM